MSQNFAVNFLNADGLNRIAHPLLVEKQEKKALELVTAACEQGTLLRGIKEVMRATRQGKKGLVLLAGNVSPIDVIAHVPMLCEEQGLPYAYVRAKEDLGAAAKTKRSTCVVMILDKKVPCPRSRSVVSVCTHRMSRRVSRKQDAADFHSSYKKLSKKLQELDTVPQQ
ncbi:MAG: hypothetical protein MHM6MM_000852 [Cercozoa sp. M6MM]